MALIKNSETREIDQLRKIEQSISRHERRERIQRIVIAGLSTLLLAALTCHVGKGSKCCRRKK